MAGVYVPRSLTTGVLHGVVRAHLADFLAAVEARTDGSGLPPFVIAEFRKFLRCGVLARGFARVRCSDCAFERLVPFSCKGRGFCPSCGGRRDDGVGGAPGDGDIAAGAGAPVGAELAVSPALPTRVEP